MNQELRNNKNKTVQIFLVSALIFILGGAGLYAYAATFDSDVIPGGSYNFTLGQSGTPWQRIFMANGDATTPSYTFGESGYQGTGIFKVPATSTLGFSTNGVERMRITAQGRVGVGTTTPSYMLDVNGAMRVASCVGCDSYWQLSGSDIYNANTGNVGIGTSTPPAAKLTLTNGAFLAQGSVGSTPVSGAGRRMMWIPAKAAFRAGEVVGSEWDDGNIGMHSMGLGYNAYPRAASSTAIGYNAYVTAAGIGGVAIGANSTAEAMNAVGIAGGQGQATSSIAIGYNTYADGESSLTALTGGAFGFNSLGIGTRTYAHADHSFVFGRGGPGGLRNYVTSSLMIGFNTEVPTLFVGPANGAGTVGIVAIGTATTTTATNVKFQVEGDSNGADMYISRAGSGLILKVTDGSTLKCAKITIANSTGAIVSTVVGCP